MTEGRVSVDSGNTPRLVVEDAPAMNECIQRLFLACQRSIRVRAPRLDFDFYYSETFMETCKSIVTGDLRNELLFLVEDEEHVMRTNTRLITLARQFSSYVKIRVIPEEYIEQPEMFVLCDDTGYLHQPNVDRPRGLLDTSDPGTVRQFKRRFTDLWDRSTQPVELFTTGL